MGKERISRIEDFSFAGTNLKRTPLAFLQDVDRPLTPEKEFTEYKIPSRDGSYIFENSYERLKIKVKIRIKALKSERPRIYRQLISPWLNIEAPLIFDDEPDKFYKARILNSIGYDERDYFNEISITFLCEPFKYQIHGDARDLITAQATMQTSGATMITNKDSFASITAPRTGTINNNGNMTCKPIIRLIGSANLLTIKVMEFACSIADIKNEEVFIDCEKMIVYKSQGTKKVNRLGSFTGRFPEIVPGQNDVAFGGNGLKIDVEFIYHNTYVV